MSLALGIELLSGRYVATAYNDRSAAEWPPHPARVLSALVATWADHDDDPESVSNAVREKAALRFLESLPAPVIFASHSEARDRRSVAPVFVPVNDVAVVSPPSSEKLDDARQRLATAGDAKERTKLEKEVAKLEKKLVDETAKSIAVPSSFSKDDLRGRILPELRTRQPRTFPSVAPADNRVVLVWDGVTPDSDVATAIESLCARVVRVGHSSSFVHMRRYTTSQVEAARGELVAFEPDEDAGDVVLRWVSRGQVDRLDAAFELHRETEPRVLPARFVRYREGATEVREEPPHSAFDPSPLVFARVGGPRLPIVSTVGVTHHFRRALMAAAEQPVPEILSGHATGGGASQRSHVAFTALPFAGHEHSDGALLGVALWLPRDASADERRAVMRAVGRLEGTRQGGDGEEAPTIQLLLGETGVLELERHVWGERTRSTLRGGTWTRASRTWASVTPVALDVNPGNLHDDDAARRSKAFDAARSSVAHSVEHIGLPPPLEIDVVRSAVIAGTAKPRSHPRFPIAADKPQRVLVHVRVVFEKPVLGPVLLGAGRYLGLGLCMPVDEEGHA